MHRAFGVMAAAALMLCAGAAPAALVGRGKAAPSWSGKTVAGKALGSAQLKGKVVLYNFFNNY